VTVLPAQRFPDLINDDETLLENSFVTPAAAPADAPAALKGTTEGARARGNSLDTLVPQDELARFGPTTPEQDRVKRQTSLHLANHADPLAPDARRR
jgi:hypothetical protein